MTSSIGPKTAALQQRQSTGFSLLNSPADGVYDLCPAVPIRNQQQQDDMLQRLQQTLSRQAGGLMHGKDYTLSDVLPSNDRRAPWKVKLQVPATNMETWISITRAFDALFPAATAVAKR